MTSNIPKNVMILWNIIKCKYLRVNSSGRLSVFDQFNKLSGKNHFEFSQVSSFFWTEYIYLYPSEIISNLDTINHLQKF